MKRDLLFVLLIPILFLITALWNLPDYGINWDSAQHFNRGQAYLHYFLTGEKNYLSLPKYPNLKGASDFRDIRGKDSQLFIDSKQSFIEASQSSYKRSYYESDVFNYEYFLASDSGHPPVNGIIAALSNKIFYQQLGLLDDVAGYQVSIILISFLLVLGVSVFVFINFGLIASIISALSLSLYPLFLAESQFNIKDPVEASFFGLAIICFYFGVTKKKIPLIFLSAALSGLALGTKFNALFLPFIILPWFAFYLLNNGGKRYFFILKGKVKRLDVGLSGSFLIFPLIPVIILFAIWPYLWGDPLNNFSKILLYYQNIGTNVSDDIKKYLLFGWDTYPSTWLILTTPLPILFFAIFGVIAAIKKVAQKKDIYFLILLWFFVPIVRVSIPGSNIYGGIRQIMEIVPPLAILSGIGFSFLKEVVKKKIPKLEFLYLFLIAVLFSLAVWDDYKIHPNQNVYFNEIAGGLSGAKEKNITSWGNSFGNAYMQGVKWLNRYAEKNARLGLPIGSMVNIPRTRVRKDIDFSNDHFSGFKRGGEYQMELSYDYSPKNWFAYQYLDKFLDPVYEVKIQNVPIFKVWKNDLEHIRKGFINESKVSVSDFSYKNEELLIGLDDNKNITRLYITHEVIDCDPKMEGPIYLSIDGKNFNQEPETLEYPQMSPEKLNLDPDKTFFFLFPGKNAKFIKIGSLTENSCLLKNPEINVYFLDDLGDVAVDI